MNAQANHQMYRFRRYVLFLPVFLVAGFLSTAHSGAQNLLVNGSFELEPIPSGQASAFGLSGWTGMNSQDAIRVLSSSGWGQLPDPLPDGNQAVTAFATGVTISQIFTFTENTSLLFSIWDTSIPSPRGGVNPFLSSVASITDGTTAKSFDFTAGTESGWRQHVWDVGTIAPGTYAFEIRLSSDVAYDHASLVVVPEPGTFSLLGFGAVLLSARFWKRRMFTRSPFP